LKIPYRVASNRNHARRSASSIQISIQTGRRVVIGFAHYYVRRPQALHKSLVIPMEFFQHLGWPYKLLVVVHNALKPGNVSDRADRGATDLAHSLGDGVGDAENLGGMFVEKKVVIAKCCPLMCQWKFLVLR